MSPLMLVEYAATAASTASFRLLESPNNTDTDSAASRKRCAVEGSLMRKHCQPISTAENSIVRKRTVVFQHTRWEGFGCVALRCDTCSATTRSVAANPGVQGGLFTCGPIQRLGRPLLGPGIASSRRGENSVISVSDMKFIFARQIGIVHSGKAYSRSVQYTSNRRPDL